MKLMLDLAKIRKVHFIGLGGIGVSAIARMMLDEGKEVSGSDLTASEITTELERLGAKVYLGQAAEQIAPHTDLVVYTIAVPDNNPELARARELKIPTRSYPEVLGEISREKFTIAISGTHGKTTTTAMVAAILQAAGLDPTVIVGSLLKLPGGKESNFIAGKSKYLVVEACEYRRSFLNLWPKILVITNIDSDHLDYYLDMSDIRKAFEELAAKVPADGKVITAKEYEQEPVNFKLLVPGDYNLKNAQAALAVARALGLDREVAVKALETFAGTWRRFEFKGKTPATPLGAGGALVYDDYAHHPTAVRAALRAARQMAGEKKLIVIFQPHLYSRTKHSFADFAKSFSEASLVIVAPIYAAREAEDPSISSEILAEAINQVSRNAVFLAKQSEMVEQILKNSGPGDLIMTMGAGDIYHLVADLLK